MRRTGRIGPRAARARHDDCGWDCDCPAGRAREWAPFPRADLDGPEWEYLTQLLMLRCGGYCESCGQPFVPAVREPNRHHRRPRGAGGTDDPTINGLANLLMLCAGPNGRLGGVAGCHGAVEASRAAAEARGLIVPWGAYTGSGEPPEVTVVFVLPSLRRVLLAPLDGAYRDPPDGRTWAAGLAQVR